MQIGKLSAVSDTLSKSPVGITIYQTERKADFLVANDIKFPDGLIIECKWQQAKGSVDEKYPFLLVQYPKNRRSNNNPTDGKGYKPNAKQWLADQVAKDMTRTLIGVWDMAEFQKKINNGFIG